MVVDRQEIIANNKSLRLIKNRNQELENLLEKGVIDDNVFDSIHQMLPNETPLSGAGASQRGTSAASNASPAPSQNPTSPPVNSMANLALSQTPSHSPAPPAYNTTGPPALPTRNNPPPPPPPSKPVIAHARALYKYNAADARDLSFERDDKIAVHEYMNADWWMGRNQRTGAEGIFPKNYVQIEGDGGSNGYANEKAATPGAGYYQQPNYAQPQQYGGGYPQPPPGQNPYNSSVPPMAVAESSSQPAPAPAPAGEPEKEGMGKKMGKKFGNAALFGAGATFGGNIVNSIF
ncbi:SH3 domain protein [Apiospora hydei]|uniref:SH3 domain protein n=1 Tax=Apiospora hydei TaxID=1337664 RepID=A0ABR1VTR6_9PEZI